MKDTVIEVVGLILMAALAYAFMLLGVGFGL